MQRFQSQRDFSNVNADLVLFEMLSLIQVCEHLTAIDKVWKGTLGILYNGCL